MPSNLQIGRCWPNDVSGLQRLIKDTWIATYSSMMGAKEARATANRFTAAYIHWIIAWSLIGAGKAIQAMDGEDIVGFAYAVSEQEQVVLYMLYVHPSHQGRGIGSRLLRSIEEWKPRAKAIRLETLRANAHAIHWYEGRGFEIYGSTKHATGTNGSAAVYLDKSLPASLL